MWVYRCVYSTPTQKVPTSTKCNPVCISTYTQAHCTFFNAVPLTLVPRYANMLGGTGVLVNGPCFDEDDSIECSFGDVTATGVFINNTLALCVTPVLSQLSILPFSLTVTKSDDSISNHTSTINISKDTFKIPYNLAQTLSLSSLQFLQIELMLSILLLQQMAFFSPPGNPSP